MDIISLNRANKAKRAIKQTQDRLGMNGTESGDRDVKDIYLNVKTRLEELEKKDPKIELYNRVSEVESNTAINLNKHNLHINSILNKNKYGLTDLVFDDFGDDSGIDQSKSTGYEFDAAGRKMKIANGQTQAEVVTTAEETDTIPQMITVSQAFNEVLTRTGVIDLVNGVHTNTEIINETIQLKKIKEDIDNTESNLALNKIVTVSGTAAGNATYITDGSISIAWAAPSGTNHWVVIDLEGTKLVSKIRVANNNTSDVVYGTKYTVWGSLDNINWTQIGTVSGLSNMKGSFYEFAITPALYRYIKFDNMATTSSSYGAKIAEVEVIGKSITDWYSPTGIYESPVLDLGDNFKDIVKIDQIINIPSISVGQTSASVYIYTSTSSDNMTFSDWQPVNPDGTITSPSARYIKVKVELIGGGEVQEKLIYDFTSTESTNFQNNDKVVFDGSLKLKIQYTEEMDIDNSFIEEGALFRKTIDKLSFKTFEKMEVI